MADNPLIALWEQCIDFEFGCEFRQGFITYLQKTYAGNFKRFMEMDCAEGVEDGTGTD